MKSSGTTGISQEQKAPRHGGIHHFFLGELFFVESLYLTMVCECNQSFSTKATELQEAVKCQLRIRKPESVGILLPCETCTFRRWTFFSENIYIKRKTQKQSLNKAVVQFFIAWLFVLSNWFVASCFTCYNLDPPHILAQLVYGFVIDLYTTTHCVLQKPLCVILAQHPFFFESGDTWDTSGRLTFGFHFSQIASVQTVSLTIEAIMTFSAMKVELGNSVFSCPFSMKLWHLKMWPI